MTAAPRWTKAQAGRSSRLLAVFACLAAILLAGALLTGGHAHSAKPLKNTILAIGTCPPWKAQAPEVCRNSLEKVTEALAPRLATAPADLHRLINEGATAPALKRKVTELANRLGPEDRLIIYANLPLGLPDDAQAAPENGYVLELWADQEPKTADQAISNGTWISAPAFAAMLHTLPAAEVILILDTNGSYAVNMHLLDAHSADHKNRPEALISSAGAGQSANYSADRTISLFAKHLALALKETEGTLQEAMTVAIGGTRQAAIPICAVLKAHQDTMSEPPADCQQVPEVHDPAALLAEIHLVPLPEPPAEE